MRAARSQEAALAAMPAHAVCPLAGAQTRKTEKARPQREPTKPDSERTARRSAPRLLSRLHFEIVLSIDLMRVVADRMPCNRVFSRCELGGQRHDQLVLVGGAEAGLAHSLLLSGRIGDFDAGKTEHDAFIELNAQRLWRGLHHASGGRAG